MQDIAKYTWKQTRNYLQAIEYINSSKDDASG